MSPVTVYVPRDSAALSVGADQVVAAIGREARQRGLEINFVRNGSRGMLWLEPLVEIQHASGRLAYGPVTLENVADLFEAGFLDGQDHELALGPTDEIPYLKNQHRLTFARCGITDPLSVEDYLKHDGLAGLRAAIRLTPAEICQTVRDSGLRGRGGAGFPTGVKWQTVLDAQSDQKYICCNADEGDSGTFADRMIMEGDPFSLIEGMAIAALGVGATEGYIYLRSEYPHAYQTLKAAISIAEQNGWIGDSILGTEHAFHLDIRIGAGAYICGEETSMLESLEGKRGQVRAKPPLPALQGLFGQPTVVNNVLSLTTVPVILAKGAAYYHDYGVGNSRGTQPFQLGGNIRCGGLVETAFGITLHELIYDFGGGTATGRPVRAVQTGGPLGAYLPTSFFQTPSDYEVFTENEAMIGHGGIVVFDDTVDMAEQARFAMEFCTHESCGKCTPCRIGSQRGEELLASIKTDGGTPQRFQLLQDLCDVMRDGSLCAMGGLTPLPVESALKHFPEDFGEDAIAQVAE